MRDVDYHFEMNADSFKDLSVNRILTYDEEELMTTDNSPYSAGLRDGRSGF
jgi:hypothetical protein